MTEKTITPAELNHLLHSDTPLTVIDVREPAEFQHSHIQGALSIPKSTIISGEALPQIPTDHLVVLYCKGGTRSSAALKATQQAGLTNVVHLQGGITQWAKQIDPTMSVY